MSTINNNYVKQQAKKIAEELDAHDGKDGLIKAETWKEYAVNKWGGKGNVKDCISVFNAINSIKYYIKKEVNNTNQSASEIGDKWYSDILNLENNNSKTNAKLAAEKEKQLIPLIEHTDALYVNNTNEVIACKTENIKIYTAGDIDPQQEKIVSDMYEKWSGIFKNSPLDKDFFDKLYNVIKELNCEIKDSDYNPAYYESKTEQTMDEVIAIMAGESKLNPKSKNGQYRGLFQLAAPGLKDLKKWAAKNKDFFGMKNIKDININEFAMLSGAEQLDYLVAYIGKAKEYSRIQKNASITPGQLWAMIKYPFKGQQNSSITAQKSKAIKKVFINSQVQQGSLT